MTDDAEAAKKRARVASEYANEVVATLAATDGVDAAALVVACARMAGTSVYRSLDLDRPDLHPGHVLLFPDAERHANFLIGSALRVLAALGVAIPSTPGGAAHEAANRRSPAFLDTQRLLEPRFDIVRTRHGFDDREAAQASAIATALLIHRLAKHLDPVKAFGIAAVGFVEGIRTVPDPANRPRAA
jgi:hypothetical protein